MRYLLGAALTIAGMVLSSPGANAFLRHGGGSTPSYTGPCDLITGGCAEAHSVTHALTSAYSGPLFQLIRLDLTTLDVGQTPAHVANLSGVYAFCAATPDLCWFSKIYAQITTSGANDLPVFNAIGQSGPNCTASLLTCAAPWWIDPPTGLPLMATSYPASFVQDGTTVGIIGGHHAISIINQGRNEQYDFGAGSYGISHKVTEFDIYGTMFEFISSYGNSSGSVYLRCSDATHFCVSIDQEEPRLSYKQASYGQAQENILGIVSWDGIAATNTVTGIINGTTAFAVSPPIKALNPETHIHLGCGGDCSHSNALFRDGMIVNKVLSRGEVAAIQTNETSFYASQSPATCVGSADNIGYAIASLQTFGGSWTGYKPTSATVLAWGLYQMRASYTGPITDLRDSTGTVTTFGSASSGCGLAATAATFCAANPPCTVAKLYNKADWNTNGTSSNHVFGNFHDTRTDMVQATVANQPTITFSSLNGGATINFSGSTYMCTGTFASGFALPMSYSVVARRTGSFTTAQVALSANAGAVKVGFGSSPATASFSPGAISQAASDSTWHSLDVDYNGTIGTPYVDAAAGTAQSTASGSLPAAAVCLGANSSGTSPLTGDIAEADVITDQITTPSGLGFASPITLLFAAQETAWGTLPH